MKTMLVLTLGVFWLGIARSAIAADYVWWEAEDATHTNMTTDMEFKPANAKEAAVLSGGAWIGRDPKIPAAECFAEYTVTAPQDGTYGFYVRKFWKHGPFRWRFDDQAWQEVTAEVALLDSSPMRMFVGANWIHAGAVKLTAGAHSLRIELLPEAKAACFDAFCLTLHPFQARGAMKPDAKYGLAADGYFPFEPDWDRMAASPIDLRSLNEKEAGDGGFIQARGEQFIQSRTGEPIRFWAVNTGHELAKMDHAAIDSAARFLAKHGVNLVRIHGGFYKGSGPDAVDINPQEMDRIFYLIAALKREGIYSGLSIHFQHWLDLSQVKEVPGYPKGKLAFGIHFFNPTYQAIFKSWWKAVLTTTNPYTDLTLGQESAIAYCEIINEDNFFFWTFKPYDAIPAEQIGYLETQFGEWLSTKYGSVEKAFATWNEKPGKVKGDDLTTGHVGLYFVGLLTNNDWAVAARNQKRAEDTARFLAEKEHTFFAAMGDYMHKDLGYRGPICGSNMSTADHTVLAPLERWTNTAVDFLDHHGYYGGERKQSGPAHFGLEVGDSYTDRSVLRFDPSAPGKAGTLPAVPFLTAIYNSKPSMCSEFAWMQPNQYQGEMAVLAAVLGRTSGLDAQIFFALDVTPQWSARMNDYWAIQTPTVIGQFPALALIYRQGLIAEGKEVVRAQLGMDKLFALKGSPVLEPKYGEDINEKTAPNGENTAVRGERIDPRAFCIGRVKVDFVPGDKHDIAIIDLQPYLDNQAKTMRSTAGDWTWDYGTGVIALRAAAAQGACGFLNKSGVLDLPDVTITSSMTYGTILVVAMDGKPLATSDRILLQVMSQGQDYGFEAKPETGMRKITNRGSGPIDLRCMAGTVTFKRADAEGLTVTKLDPNGYPTSTATGAAHIELAKDVLYYVIEHKRN